MTAFTPNTGGTVYWDSLSGGSVIATLDTYAIGNGTTFVIRTDTNACPNHSVAFGSLDTVTFTDIGGTLHFDPTYVRVIAYTGGSGNSPAFGTTITANNGTTGVFLGAWTNWLSECIVPGSAIGATGYIKLGGVSVPGNFNAGALTGITATCSGADVQGWIEVRGADTGTITVPRIGKVTSTEAWYEIGTTNGSRGQIIACPTCATNAGVWPGVWIESSAGSGVYERYAGAGSQVAISTTRTDASLKIVWQTTSGIRIGNDGTNGVGYLPPTGCKVRIPAIIWTNCTRNGTTGSGPRVLPNSTIATRQEFVTTGAGYFDLRGIVCQWYVNFSQAFYVKWHGCAINDAMILSEIASPLDVDDCIVAPTQAQLNVALQVTSCFAGGTIQNSNFWRFSLATAVYVTTINYATNVTFGSNIFGSLTLRANSGAGIISSTQPVSCTFTDNTFIGGQGVFIGPQKCTFNNTKYYDHTLTTTTSSTNPMYILSFTTGGSGNVISGFTLPLPANGPYTGLVGLNACYDTVIKLVGTSVASPLVLNSSVTGVGVTGLGNNDGITIKRMYLSNTRTGPYAFVNSDTNIVIENTYGDYADTTVMAGLNAIEKNVGITSATTGQVSVYGTHWKTRFTSATAGFTEVTCNEPTASSATQCYINSGTPQFNSSGSILMTVVGQQVTWEMPFFALGYTAFTNSAPTITGTNVTYSSGARWGNHDIEFQIDTGSGYNGSWLALTAANLTAQTINGTTGFKLKIRVTTATASATNAITNMRIAMTTDASTQAAGLYPLSSNTVSFTGLPTGTDVVVLTAGTTTILAQVDANPTSTYSYTYSGAQTVDVGFIKPGYIPQYIRGLSLTTTDSSIPVALMSDRNYV